MAIRGVNLTRNVRFVSDQDPDKGNEGAETAFILRPLDGIVSAFIGDNLMTLEQKGTPDRIEQVTRVNTGKVSYETLQWAIIEAHNFLDADGMPIELLKITKSIGGKSYSVASDDFMRQVPPDIREEMYTHYMAELKAANQAKKSAPQS